MLDILLYKGILTKILRIPNKKPFDVYVGGKKINPAEYTFKFLESGITEIIFREKFAEDLGIIALKAENLEFKVLYDKHGEIQIFDEFKRKLRDSYEIYMKHLSQGGNL